MIEQPDNVKPRDQWSDPRLIPAGHQQYFYAQPFSYIYDYDPAEDGPECEVITRILAAYPNEVRTR